jgi:hypothetical protein
MRHIAYGFDIHSHEHDKLCALQPLRTLVYTVYLHYAPSDTAHYHYYTHCTTYCIHTLHTILYCIVL